MEIIKRNIEEMMKEINYAYEENKYPDNQLNILYNYYTFLNKCEDEIIDSKKASLKIIIYSKYYWHSRFVDRFREVYGFDAGIEQQQYLALEEIDHRVEDVDWEFVEKLEYGKEL